MLMGGPVVVWWWWCSLQSAARRQGAKWWWFEGAAGCRVRAAGRPLPVLQCISALSVTADQCLCLRIWRAPV